MPKIVRTAFHNKPGNFKNAKLNFCNFVRFCK